MQTYSKVTAVILVEVTAAGRTGHAGGLHVGVRNVGESNVWGGRVNKSEDGSFIYRENLDRPGFMGKMSMHHLSNGMFNYHHLCCCYHCQTACLGRLQNY